MFGYILANRADLTGEQQARYRACYCGLCRTLGDRCGQLSRLTLTYDMTFLVLLLGSLYEPEEQSGADRCLPHPTGAHGWARSEVTDYAADMNLILACYNLQDDWQDDKNPAAGLAARALSGPRKRAEARWPRQAAAIRSAMEQLARMEREDLQHPDAPARAFGELMAQLMVWKTDRWEPDLRQLGHCLGQYIYILDAYLDLEGDLKKGRYNPFRRLAQEGALPDMEETLTMLIGGATQAFERLPLVQDVGILRNILYAGVWARYVQWKQKGEKKQK